MDLISIKDFEKLDIRIGTVVGAEVPKWSHWVIKMTVDFNDPSTRSARSGQRAGTRTVFSGIMKFYKPEDLIGKQFPFIVNLEPKKIGPEGDISEGMMIMATPSPKASAGEAVPSEEDVPPVLFKLAKKVPNGSRVR